MSSAIFSWAGFAAPYFTLALPFALLAFYVAYRRGGRGYERVVASVMLLKQLSRPIAAPKKIKLPWRFFVELLIAILLILSAAGLYFRSAQGRLVLLVDNSLSMAARSLSGSQTERAIDRAKQEAERVLSGASIGAEVAVYVTSPALRQLSKGYGSVAEARQLLEAIEPAYAADNIAPAIDRLLQTPEVGRVVVFTDRHLRINGPEGVVDARYVGASDLGNLAISDLRVSGLGADRDGFSLALGAKFAAPSTGAKSAEVSLVLSSFDARLGSYQEVQRRTLLMPRGERAEQVLEVSSNARAFKIDLEPIRSTSSLEVDAIREDNHAFLVAKSGGAGTLVISDLSAQQLGLDKLPIGNPEVRSLAEFRAAQRPALSTPGSQAKLVILHRVIPDPLPEAPLLVVLPPVTNQTFPVLQEVERAQITRVLDGHPVTSYLNMVGLSLPSQRVLKVPGWAQEMVSSTAGAALYAGALAERRVVVSGFELFPYEGKKSPALSVLTLNILRWLSSASLEQAYVPVFSAVAVPNGVEKVENELREALKVSREGTRAVVVPAEPGLMLGGEGETAQAIGAANFFDEGESNPLENEPIDLTVKAGPEIEQGSRSFTQNLALAALALLMLELVGALLFERRASYAA